MNKAAIIQNNITKLLFAVLLFVLASQKIIAQNISAEEGKKLFAGRCASCHNVNKHLTGPALAKVDERYSEAWILNFVKSSQAMVKAGDKEALAVFNQNNQVIMPDHPDLSNDQIKSIIEYVKTEAKNTVADEAPFPRPGKKVPNLMPLSIYNYPVMLGYLALIILLIAIMVFFVNVKSYETRNYPEENEDFFNRPG